MQPVDEAVFQRTQGSQEDEEKSRSTESVTQRYKIMWNLVQKKEQYT